jgi:hypothetical protein
MDGFVLLRACAVIDAQRPLDPVPQELRVLSAGCPEDTDEADEEGRDREGDEAERQVAAGAVTVGLGPGELHESEPEECQRTRQQEGGEDPISRGHPSRPTSRLPSAAGTSFALSMAFHAYPTPGGLADTVIRRSRTRPRTMRGLVTKSACDAVATVSTAAASAASASSTDIGEVSPTWSTRHSRSHERISSTPPIVPERPRSAAARNLVSGRDGGHLRPRMDPPHQSHQPSSAGGVLAHRRPRTWTRHDQPS